MRWSRKENEGVFSNNKWLVHYWDIPGLLRSRKRGWLTHNAWDMWLSCDSAQCRLEEPHEWRKRDCEHEDTELPAGYRGMADAPEDDAWPSHKKRTWDGIGEIKQLSLNSIYKTILNCDRGQTIYDYLVNNTMIRNNLCEYVKKKLYWARLISCQVI